MGWDPNRRALHAFDQFVKEHRLTIAPDAPIARPLEVVREFLRDIETLDREAIPAKWNPRFAEFYNAVIEVYRLTDAVATLASDPLPLRSRLKHVLAGPLTQDFVPQQAKDFFYELEIAAALKKAGFTVSLREPDVVVSGNGLKSEIGLACKYPSSAAQVHAHISKGYKQIAKCNLAGCVVIGLDLIVMNEVFESPPPYLDLGGGSRHPRNVGNDLLNTAIQKLVIERARDYPAEKPLDGCILTYGSWGIFGSPAGIASLSSWMVQCDADNPLLEDLKHLVSIVGRLDTELHSPTGKSSPPPPRA